MHQPKPHTISAAAFDHLRRLGQKKGFLLVEDLAEVVPIGNLPPHELADLVVRLENAGVAIELEPALLLPRDDVREAHGRREEKIVHPASVEPAHAGTPAPSNDAGVSSRDPAKRFSSSKVMMAVAAILAFCFLMLLIWSVA